MKTPTRRDFLKTTSVAAIGAAIVGTRSAAAQSSPATTASVPASRGAINKRDRMMDVLNMKSPPKYIPAAFFMHFGVKGDEAVKAHLDHFRATDMDFVKIQFDEQRHTLPAGVDVKTPADWAKIPVLTEKWFEPSLYLLKQLVKEAKNEALIIQTLYSPYQLAKQAVTWQVLVDHVKQDAEAVCRGMENVTLSLMNFVRASQKLGADGFYMCAQGGEKNRVADRAAFNKAIKSYDMMLYKHVSELTSFNIMHLCDYDGTYDEFEARFGDYPGHVVNVPLAADGKELSMKKAAEMFKRPIMGGLDRHGAITKGTVEEARKAAIAALETAPANFILGADCTVALETPKENLRAAAQAAHTFRA